MISRRRALYTACAFVAALSLLVVLGATDFAGRTEAVHGGMDAMSIDMNPAGNSSGAVDTIDTCARINKNGTKDADEDAIDEIFIDVTAEGIPAYSNNGTPSDLSDDSGGITGYQYTLNYPALFTVSDQNASPSPPDPLVNIVAANNANLADVFNGSEAVPDATTSNYNTWDSLLVDTGTDTPESGEGVLDRLSIRAEAGVLTGQYLVELTGNGHSDASGAGYQPHTTGVANIAVGPQACGALITSLGYYHPVTPRRILDTRPAPFGPIGVPAAGKVGPGGILVDVTNTLSSGVPASGVTAVVVNTTVTGPTEGSHLTVYPSDAGLPNAANLNFVVGQTVPNLVTVKVGPDGNVKLRNNSGQTDVIFDIQGWYGVPASGSRYNPIPPKRILDTRPAPYGPIGVDQNGVPIPAAQIGPGGVLTVDVTNTVSSGVPNSGVTGVIVNVTVTGPTATSHLTVYPSDAVVAPNAANLNFVAGQTVPNLVAVKVGTADGSGGSVRVRNNSGSTHVIFDVVGWYGASSGDVFNPLPPNRILDTRPAPYGPIGVAGKVGTGTPNGQTISVQARGVGGVPSLGPTAVIVNTTVTEPTEPSHLTVYPSDVSLPNAANLNFVGGQTVPNLVVVKVGVADGKVNVYNFSGQTHVIFDIAGYFGPVP